MARCPDCNKFVSYGEPEIEVSGEEIDTNSGMANCEVRIALTCGECGTELKETTEMCEVPLPDAVTDDWTVDVSAEPAEKSEGSGRGRKMFYGADVSFDFIAPEDEEALNTCASGEVYVQASYFDDCY